MRIPTARHPIVVLTLAGLFALLPTLVWYGRRLLAVDGEVWSLLPLIAVVYFFRQRTRYCSRDLYLRPAAVTLLMYCLLYAWIPPILRALFALSTLALVLCADRDLRRFPPALWVLLLLALPVVASLQFYLGYPVRVVAGDIAALLLNLNGLTVVREGGVLSWGGSLVCIDAPCSGIKMLWSGLLLSSLLAANYRLRWLTTIVLILMTVAIVVVGNALRVTSLFYIETGILPVSSWAHDTIGLISFGVIAGLLVWQSRLLQRREAV